MASEPGGSSDPARVPLHERHAARGARFTPFAGYEMPLQFDSILTEHQAVREKTGLFDVSHMSNLEVPADQATELASGIAADATQLDPGRAKYTVTLREDGTILDDIIVFHLGQVFHVIPNAGMNNTVATHLETQGCQVKDRTRSTCILALQGPGNGKILEQALPELAKPGRFQTTSLDGGGFASGTGYTGEDGVEFVVPAETAGDLWDALLDAGAQPCGLGCRDTLRLEKGYALAGNEFDPPVTPVEARLLWTVDLDHPFTGREAVIERKQAGAQERLTGLKLDERGIPRRGCDVLAGDEVVGRVSSGTMSPTLGTGIALAYIHPDHTDPGTELAVDVRGRHLAAHVEEVPFV